MMIGDRSGWYGHFCNFKINVNLLLTNIIINDNIILQDNEKSI